MKRETSSPNFKILKGHTLEEYFKRYGQYYNKGKVFDFTQQEMWLMDERFTYWEIVGPDKIKRYYQLPKHHSLIVSSVIAAVCLIAIVTGIGIYHHFISLNKETYHVEIVDTPQGVCIEGSFIKEKGYQGTIKIDTSIVTDKLLPDSLDYVKSGEETISTYTYDLSSDELSASLLIPEKSIKGDIKIKLTLVEKPAPIIINTITLDANGGYFADKETKIELMLTNQQHLSDFPDYAEPTPTSDEYEFKYWLDGDKVIKSDTILEYTSDVTLKAFYDVKCAHDYHFQVSDHQLYSVCSKCGKTIHYSDEELITDFDEKMLVNEGDDLKLHDSYEFSSIVNKGEPCEFYFINGKYHLDGNPVSPTDVIIHGINNNEGKMNASIICYKGEDGLYPVEIGNLKLNIDNIIMQGQVNQSDLFYNSGLEPYSLICNNCNFIGEQALFPKTVEIKNSCFDTTSITGGGSTDYAFYTYTAKEVSITDSTFNSLGKAIKVYGAGAIGTHLVITHCTFNAGEDSLSNKAAIQIDSTEQTMADPFKVDINQCTFNGRFANKHWDDSVKPSPAIVSEK